jgi:uncharacterized protein (DUF305 family)
MKLESALFTLCAGLTLSLPALAQGMTMDHHNTSNMMMQDLGPSDAKYDLRFLNAMIMHHEGALVMADDALKKSKRPEIQKLAKDIIAAQQKEIAQMKLWRKTWYKQ